MGSSANLQGYDCCTMIQAMNVWSTNQWSCKCFCDNCGVVKNLSIPESTLMKKHNAIS